MVLTELGKARMQLADKYLIGRFYQPEVGNIVIPDRETNPTVMENVLLFVQENTDWVLGHEDDYWYITSLEDLQGT